MKEWALQNPLLVFGIILAALFITCVISIEWTDAFKEKHRGGD